MGMFDTFNVKYKLPNGKVDFEAQTKSFDCTLGYVTIEAGGTMTRDYGSCTPESIKESDDAWNKAVAEKAGIIAMLKARGLRVWVPNVRQVDFTGIISIDEYHLEFSHGNLVKINESPPSYGYTPFDAPPLEDSPE